MSLFKPGNKVKRIQGQNHSRYGMFLGNTYIVDRCNEHRVTFVGISSSYSPDYFELVTESKKTGFGRFISKIEA